MMNARNGSSSPTAGNRLTWGEVVASFRVISADHLLSMHRLERHQDIRNKPVWLAREEKPLALLFISHRWETLEQPDPTGQQLRAIQQFLGTLCICVEAMLVPRRDRLRLVPSLAQEGILQAEEVARRVFGFGPFSDDPASAGGEARRIVGERFRIHREDKEAFRRWLLSRIGVWLDYICMPQEPFSAEEDLEFRRSLRALDSLVRSSIVVALRQDDDDYAVRGWCVAEFYLASARSFSRGLFLDVNRLKTKQEVLIPRPPTSSGGADAAAKVMLESYEQHLIAFRSACEAWSGAEGPLLDVSPPDAWFAYRGLQGSGFYTPDKDPNPFRRALEAIRSMETALIEKWLMSEKSRTFDLGNTVGHLMQRFGMRCSKESDLVYLGFLLACNGWIDAFRPLFRDCLLRYLGEHRIQDSHNARHQVPILAVTLKSLDGDVRALFSEVEPTSAGTWHSRLTSGPGSNPQEATVIQRFRDALEHKPPEFVF